MLLSIAASDLFDAAPEAFIVAWGERFTSRDVSARNVLHEHNARSRSRLLRFEENDPSVRGNLFVARVSPGRCWK